MTTPMASAPKQLETKWTPGPWLARLQSNKHQSDLGWIIEFDNGRIGWASLAYADTNSEADKSDPARKANARLIAASPIMAEALSEVLGALAWINAQAESAMATSAGAATADGDPNGALEMLNSIASDIGINAMMQADKVEALLAKIGGDA